MTNSSDRRSTPRPAPPPGQPAKPTSPYSRFIPREELNSFSAWNPTALSGAGESVAPLQRAQPPVAPPPPGPSPEDVLAEHVRTARSGGYQDGYRDGLTALEGFKQSYASQVTAQVGAVTQAYNTQLDALHQTMARALAVTATQLARQMVRSELSTRPGLVVAVAQEAIDTLLLSARHITVRVNPDDHALVAQGAAEVLAARGARLLSDATVTRGGCVVESDIGAIDASIENRWRRTAAVLGCDQGWDGVTVDPDKDSEADEAAK